MTESEGKKEKEEERVRDPLISSLHSLFYNGLQLWLQIKPVGFFFLLSSLVIICSEMPGWRYDNNTAKGEGTQLKRKGR